MSQHASLGTAAGARGIYNARHILPLSWHKIRIALAPEFLPAKSSAQLRAQWGLRNQHSLHTVGFSTKRLQDRPPQVILNNQNFGFGVRQQLQMLIRGELV